MRVTNRIAGLIGLMTLAACATNTTEPVTVASDAEMRAVIQTVDPVTREVLLRTEDGRLLSVIAGSEVRNFDQLDAGDTVVTAFAESITVGMAAPGSEMITRAATADARAEPGERPGAAMGTAVDAVVEWVRYDPETTLSTFIGASGLAHSVLTPPEMRDLAASFRTGDPVEIQYSSAVAIEIEEIAD